MSTHPCPTLPGIYINPFVPRHSPLRGLDGKLLDNDFTDPDWHDRRTWRDAANVCHEGFEVTNPHEGQYFIAGGGARVTVHGDVFTGADIRVAGGGASVEVNGDVRDGALIYVSGGGATVIVRGTVQDNARIIIQGGGARVLLGHNLEEYTA